MMGAEAMRRRIAGAVWQAAKLAGGAVFAVTFVVVSIFAALGAMAEEKGDFLRATGFRMAGDETRTRIVLDYDKPFKPQWFLLRKPFRLVVDMPRTVFAVDPSETKARGLVSIVRYGQFDDARSRMILGGDSPFVVDSIEVIDNGDGPGHRLAIDLVVSSPDAFDQALARQSGLKTGVQTAPKDDRLGVKNREIDAARPFTIVIDPGHGGIDGGARGVSGISEKTITLDFSIELKKKLEETGEIRIFLTRDEDKFLRLSERVAIARQYEADLFISVHADTIRFRGVRGATVYTVSDKASDEVAHAIASNENLADQLAGIAPEESNHQVTDILLDLMRRETQTFSIRFARSLVGEMSNKIELIKNPHRFAGFRVLTAPDVPSVLVELGYLSNPKDEAQLRDPRWRDKASDSIVSAVRKYAAAHSGMGG